MFKKDKLETAKSDEQKKEEAERKWLIHPCAPTLGDFMTATRIEQDQLQQKLHWEHKMREAEYELAAKMANAAGISANKMGLYSSCSELSVAKPLYEGAYNKKTPCKACGTTGAKSEFHANTDSKHDYSFIRRTCKNCGHVWIQIPLHLIPALVAERMTDGVEDDRWSRG